MPYQYRLGYAATNPGEVHTAVVYADSGVALVSQPTYNIRDLGDGAYLYITTAMPDGQGGCVKILGPNGLVSVGVISPQEVENADEKVSLIPAGVDAAVTASHGAGLYTAGGAVPPGTHKLYGFEQDASGAPVDGRIVKAAVFTGPQVSTSGIVETGTKITHSNGDGYWFFNLLAGVEYAIDIPEAGVKGKLVILSADTDFRTLLP